MDRIPSIFPVKTACQSKNLSKRQSLQQEEACTSVTPECGQDQPLATSEHAYSAKEAAKATVQSKMLTKARRRKAARLAVAALRRSARNQLAKKEGQSQNESKLPTKEEDQRSKRDTKAVITASVGKSADNGLSFTEMPHRCCVPQCPSESKRQQNANAERLSFHTFPKDEEIRKEWRAKIFRSTSPSLVVTAESQVCSLHFRESDYESGSHKIRGQLKVRAVPSIFPWTTAPKQQNERAQASRGHLQQVTLLAKKLSVTTSHNPAIPTQLLQPNWPGLTITRTLPQVIQHLGDQRNKIRLLMGNIDKCHCRLANSETDVKFYTGFQTFQALKAFFEFVVSGNAQLGHSFVMSSSLRPGNSLLEELFMTLIRLRKGFSEKTIGELYEIPPDVVSQVVTKWITLLAERLHHLPVWLSKEMIKRSLPSCFKQYYPNCRMILDCIEISIERPEMVHPEHDRFAACKFCDSAKGFVVLAPTGQVIFVSQLYAGTCSDRRVVQHCGLLERLDAGDEVLADRGFDIEEDLERRKSVMVIPPFPNSRLQFTDMELAKTNCLEAVRVHVQRAIQRIKEYTILTSVIPSSLCPVLDKLWFVCVILSNFTGTLKKS